VIKVADGSAANKAGIQQGDFITKINGKVINNSLMHRNKFLHLYLEGE
jgi:S1-C subfamily serine protease